MLVSVKSGQFKRDVKRAKRRGKDLSKLRAVLQALVEARAAEDSQGSSAQRELARLPRSAFGAGLAS